MQIPGHLKALFRKYVFNQLYLTSMVFIGKLIITIHQPYISICFSFWRRTNYRDLFLFWIDCSHLLGILDLVYLSWRIYENNLVIAL